MITSYEVGAIFKIVDQASPVLKLLADQFNVLDRAILRTQEGLAKLSSQRFAGLGTRLKGINEQMAALGVNSDKAFAGMGAAFDSALVGARALKVEMAEIAAISRRVGTGVAASGGGGGFRRGGYRGGGGGHGGGGPRFGYMSAPIPGGSHLHMGGNAALAGAGLLGYGVYEAGQMEDDLFGMLYHSAQKDTPQNRDKLRKVIQGAMSTTGYGLTEVAEAATTALRMFRGTPGNGLDVLPELLKAAAIESRLKKSTLNESMNSFIGLSHMTKEYSPEEIKKLAPAFAFLSASNPSSLKQMEGAASYVVPMLQTGLEMDPVETLLMSTVLRRAGATSTKSGTWLRNMFMRAMPEPTLPTDPRKADRFHALQALGLVDNKGKALWFDHGKPSAVKFFDIASEHAANLPLSMRAATEKNAFGALGMGAFALLADPAVKAQVKAMRKEMDSEEFQNRYAGFMKEYSEGSPVQKFRETWEDLKIVLMDMGSIVLPPLVVALKQVDENLKTITSAFAIMRDTTTPIGETIDKISQAMFMLKKSIDLFFSGIGNWLKPTSLDGGGAGGGSGIQNINYHPGGANDNGGVFRAIAGGGSGNFGGAVASAASIEDARSGSATLQRYLATGGVGMNSATTAWCAAFVNAALAHAGIQGTGSLAAGSFAHWGSAVHGSLMAGDIIGHGKGWGGHSWGHVMMATGRHRGDLWEVIEGNSGHRVKHDWINPHSEQFIRRGQHINPYKRPHNSHPQALYVMLDGRQIHHSVVRHERRATEHSHQAPAFDGYQDFSAPDGQIWAA